MLVSPPVSSHRTATIDGSTAAVPLKNAQHDHSLPLAGVVICCTSIVDEKRTSLAAHAEQMGAIHRFDLTLDATHLIVGHHDTDKYKFVARGRPDVRPMTTDWIEAVRELWMNDQEINLDELERIHTLPTLHGLRLSMTGCDEISERLSIAERVKSNGAVYEGNMGKDITHLIAFRTEGEKYKAARNWGLKTVSVEWLNDSLERGMILNESLYDPTLPVAERGKGAWDKSKPKRPSLGKRQREESMAAAAEGGKKKLRRTASMKLNSQSDQMWGDIIGGAANVAQVNRSGQWDSTEEMVSAVEDRRKPKPDTGIAGPRVATEKPRPDGMFTGHSFHYYGFNPKQAEIIQNHLLAHGARIWDSLEELVRSTRESSTRLFILIPHDVPLSYHQHHDLLPSKLMIETVTIWWLERCLHNKKFMEPKDHVIGRPFKQFPVGGFQHLSISTSGFSGIDLLHITKAIKLLGASYSEDMTPQTSVIVVRTLIGVRPDKVAFSREWKIPIVKATWLFDSIEAGKRLGFQEYRGQGGASTHPKRAPEEPVINCLGNIVKPPVKGKSLRPGQPLERPSLGTNPDKSKVPDTETTDEPASVDPFASTTEPVSEEFTAQPLSERDANSPSKTVSTASAPSDLPNPAEDYDSEAISDLLAKTKTAIPSKEASKPGRRGPKRILGRVPSNMSIGSGGNSRANSIDPTARGSFIGEESTDSNEDTTKTRPANEHFEMLMKGNTRDDNEGQQPPPATQIGYYDEESNAAEKRARSRMMGDKEGGKSLADEEVVKAKTLTINDVGNMLDNPRVRRTRASGR